MGEGGWMLKGEGPASALNASLPSLVRDDEIRGGKEREWGISFFDLKNS